MRAPKTDNQTIDRANVHWVPIDWVNIINDSKYWHGLYNQNKQSSTACLKTTFCKNTPSNMLVNSQHPVKHGGDVLRPYILRCEQTPTHLFSLSVSFLKRLENYTRLQKCLLSLKVTLPPARQKMQMWSHSKWCTQMYWDLVLLLNPPQETPELKVNKVSVSGCYLDLTQIQNSKKTKIWDFDKIKTSVHIFIQNVVLMTDFNDDDWLKIFSKNVLIYMFTFII